MILIRSREGRGVTALAAPSAPSASAAPDTWWGGWSA